MLLPGPAKRAEKAWVVRNKEILECVVEFAKRFGCAGEFAEDVSWNLYCMAHD